MKINNFIDFSKYKRFFAFGCSFTDYKWPMWPEVISKFIPEYYNFGCSGCDNRIIYLRILEADTLYNFNQDDLVLIMWTNIWRDTYFDPVQNFQLKRVADENLEFKEINFIFRDFCFFKSIYHLLEHKKLDYDFLSISGYTQELFEKFHLFSHKKYNIEDVANLINLFSVPLNSFKQSMFELSYDLNWQQTKFKFSHMINSEGKVTNDNHPTPLMSLEYLQKIYPKNDFSTCYDYMKEYEDKIAGTFLKERIHPSNSFDTVLLRYPLIT